MVATMTWLTAMEYLCYKWSRYVPLVTDTSWSFPHSWLITRCVARLIRLVPLVEHELPTLPDRLRSPPVLSGRRVWRYQRGNHNPYIEGDKTTQWPKEKGQKDKQWSTKHTHKTKDRVIRTPIKTGDERRCCGRVSSFCSTSGTRRVNLVTNPVISRKWGKDQAVTKTSGDIRGSS